jgi:hypothetical protein
MKLKRSPFIALIVLGIIIIGSGALYLYLVNNSNVFKSNTGKISLKKLVSLPSTTPAKLYESNLDGTLVIEENANKHPLGVMIENHPAARPQSGLAAASVVYEAIAEGGITRYLAIYGPNSADKIGPIRSARTYFADWCNEYDCYYAHVGGNYDALRDKIPGDKIKDIDQFANAGAYWREPQKGVASEHTMFSSTTKLYELVTTKKWSTPIRENFDIYTFTDDPKTTIAASISKINIDFSSPSYLVNYVFNPTKNSYARNLAGKADIDLNGNTQIEAKNIIIQYISRTAVVTAINETGWAMPTVGSGRAVIYQNGTKTEGSWKKTDKYARTQFLGSDGQLITLNRGATWVEVVNPGSTVTDN